MSSQEFDAQLLIPDNNASHTQLADLVAAGDFTGRGLPNVAHNYLNAFCNSSFSDGRRRWVGIALVGMMRMSASVVEGLKKLPQGLLQIGAIVLDGAETEERRIIAGLIIRQGLEAGIDFTHFWESSKVLDSAPNFPRETNELWMSQFQTYLDRLSKLVPKDMNTNAVVMYPISLFVKGGFQWAGKSAVAIVERGVFTIVVSNPTLTDFSFVEIPISYIRETSLQQDSPHESQEGRSGHRMHIVTITLRPGSPNYRLNASDDTASDVKVSFLQRDDAYDLQSGLQNACKRLPATNTGAEVPELTGRAQDHNIGKELDSSLAGILDDGAPSKPSRQAEHSTQHCDQGRSRGKLPSISRATKQKAARTQQLPSSSPKVPKARAAKTAAPIVDASETDDESEDSSPDEYILKSTAQNQQSINRDSVGKLQSRRKKSDVDEDFVPNKQKSKATLTKRKRASSDAAESSQPKKKRAQTKSTASMRALTASTTSKRRGALESGSEQTGSAQARAPMMQTKAQGNIQNVMPARHSLIGGLISSKSPSTAVAPTFKKPDQPASTPGRPKSNRIRTTPKPHTPHAPRRDLEDPPIYISRTPRSQTIHEEDFGHDHTPIDEQILSSNTKRVPDSPHADSTAISGHADQDEVHREMCKGDLQTAKSDPFQQRREGQKLTKPNSFTRKLTAESPAESGKKGDTQPSLAVVEPFNDDSAADGLASTSASQSWPKHSPSLFNNRTQSRPLSRPQNHNTQTKHCIDLSKIAAKLQRTDTATSHGTARSLQFEDAHSMPSSRNNHGRTQKQIALTEKSSPVPRSQNRSAPGAPVDKGTQLNDSVVSALREAVEDTLLEAPQQQTRAADLDGDTTLIGEDADVSADHISKEPDLLFRSSPPIPDSSSVRDASSDESDQDDEPSPPTSRADELDWEDALQPHQRDLHEQLLRTSKRVMRHIVDNETAVTDIADTFANDGKRLLDLMLKRQSNEAAETFQDLESKKQSLLKELSNASENLKQQRKQMRAAE